MTIPQIISSKKYYRTVSLYVMFTLIISLIGFGKLPGGVRIFTNKKVSMEPLISSNSLTIVKPSNYYEVGDIISYYQQIEGEEIIVTHRITQIGGNVYVTKGDYNAATDSQVVRPRLIIGKVIMVVPYVGYLFSVVKQPLGVTVFILLPAVVIIGSEIFKILKMVR